MDPLVHVAIPVRDVASWVDEALLSLRAQTMDRWSATVVDDGSQDDTAARVAAHAAADPRIRLLRQGREGLVPALLRATTHAGPAPFLARMDGDDTMAPSRLATQVALLEDRRDLDIVDCRYELIGDAVKEGMRRYARWHDGIQDDGDFRREELVENPVCHPASMMRVSSLAPLGPLYRAGDFPEDYDLWLRARRAGLRFHKLSPRLLSWRERVDRATRTDPRYRMEAFFRLRWEHLVHDHLGGRPRVAVWGAKERGRPWIRALVQGGYALVGVVDIDPLAVGRMRHGVPIVAPDALAALHPDLVLAAVGSAGARALIEAQVAAMGLRCIAVAGLWG